MAPIMLVAIMPGLMLTQWSQKPVAKQQQQNQQLLEEKTQTFCRGKNTDNRVRAQS